MAQPPNPLDRYATYAYHFELHCANTTEALLHLYSSDENATTLPNMPNGTLLINTRKDAHQSIDDVRYTYTGPFVNHEGTAAALVDLSLKITEPGGIAFAEKIQRAAKQWQINSIGHGMHFLLKVIFVGRYSDNRVEELREAPFGNCFLLQLTQITGEYSHKGGEYILTFTNRSNTAAPSAKHPEHSIAKSIGYSHKNVTLTARTVREAIEKLEQKLNDNYDKTFVLQEGTRKIKYKINLDPEIDGKLYLINADTFVEDDEVKMSWHPSIPIIDMIKSILGSSKEIHEMIGDSLEGLRKPHHPGVKLPTFLCRYELTDTEAIVYYDICLYEGTGTESEDDFIFDCYFAEAGKNVDVLDFEIKFITMMGWLDNKMKEGVDFYTNISGQVATDSDRIKSFTQNALVPNKTLEKYTGDTIHEYNMPFTLPMDVIIAPSNPRQQDTGFVHLRHTAVGTAKMAMSTEAEAASAVDPQMTFDIRGHHKLLLGCMPNPRAETAEPAFGIRRQLWTKVNIRDMNGNPFFYTGWYEILSVDNIFSGGKFTQKLTVVMVPDAVQKGIQ